VIAKNVCNLRRTLSGILEDAGNELTTIARQLPALDNRDGGTRRYIEDDVPGGIALIKCIIGMTAFRPEVERGHRLVWGRFLPHCCPKSGHSARNYRI
jgi:hypothetical protein